MARPRKRENQGLPSGMLARRQRSGARYYYASMKCPNSGRRKEHPLGPERIAAFRKYADLLDEKVSHHQHTFVDLVARYEKEVIPKKAAATQRGNLQELKQLSKFFANPPAPLNEITPRRVAQYLAWRGHCVRANREKALLSHMLNKAREWGWMSMANPCAGIRGASEKGRGLYIEDAAFDMICDHADPPTRATLTLAYLTGLRPSDTLSLTSVNIVGEELVVKPGKTENSTAVKIRFRLVNEDGSLNSLGLFLESLRPNEQPAGIPFAFLRDSKGYQFTKGQLRGGFDKAKDSVIQKLNQAGNAELAAHVSQVQVRDIRAKAATDKVVRTGDLRAAQKQLGHASATMTEHYVRARLGDVVEPTK